MPHDTPHDMPRRPAQPQPAMPSLAAAGCCISRRRCLATLGSGGGWLLGGCAAPMINTQHRALGQDSRVQFVVLHFTGETLADSMHILTQQQVSAHYLVSDQTPPLVYRLVDEDQRAWHAGDSSWQGHTQLNASSIGIEIVNPGEVTGTDGQRRFAPYPTAQIDVLITLLQRIVARHGIRRDRIVGHSDIAPQRKLDPGPAFPWQRLAEAGLIHWPDAAQMALLRPVYQAHLPAVAWWQQTLAQIGYSVPSHGVLDAATRRVIAAFQMKLRPQRHDGQPDAETAALAQALLLAQQPAASCCASPAIDPNQGIKTGHILAKT